MNSNWSDYFYPLLISNVIALAILVLAWLRPAIARLVIGLLFSGAGLFNTYTALVNPEAYLNYADLAWWPLYRNFINGLFATNIAGFILAIALGQLLIGLGFLTGWGNLFRIAVAGAVLFFLGILPLGVGSAFPFPLILIAAVVLVYLNWRAAGDAPAPGGV